MISKILTICSLAIAVYVSSTTVANACRCNRAKPPLQYLNQVDAVFIGEVTRVKKANYGNIAKLKVIKSYKGVDKKSVTLDTGMGKNDCGIMFIDDLQYLVYATKKDKILQTNICMRTKPITQVQKEISILDSKR